MNNIRWENQECHLDRLREFYYNNKNHLEENLKRSFLDAIDCMNFVIEQKKKDEQIAIERKKKKEEEDKIFIAIKNS